MKIEIICEALFKYYELMSFWGSDSRFKILRNFKFWLRLLWSVILGFNILQSLMDFTRWSSGWKWAWYLNFQCAFRMWLPSHFDFLLVFWSLDCYTIQFTSLLTMFESIMRLLMFCLDSWKHLFAIKLHNVGLIKDVLLFLVFLTMKPLGNLKIDTPFWISNLIQMKQIKAQC
jgi:hypothetical protein